MTLERYLASKRTWEVLFWIVFLGIGFLSNVAIVWIEHARSDAGIMRWEPVVWEGTSIAVQGLLIPLILRFDAWFPIALDSWRRSVPAHAVFTLVYSLLHVTLMYWSRVAIYRIHGDNSGYHWPNWWADFGYEYLKDFRTYILILVIVYLYRFVLRRLRGEAGFVSEGNDEKTVPVTDRFLIKKLGREFLVRVDDIDWIESAGNYVNLHVDSKVYPLRETMAGIAERLDGVGFQRVHRGAVVNLNRVAEIRTRETGDGEIHLTSSVRVPMSRRYRKRLKERVG
jgi:hypothetical protein